MPNRPAPTFRVKPIGTLDVRAPTMDHLSDGERSALTRGNLHALEWRRQTRWNKWN